MPVSRPYSECARILAPGICGVLVKALYLRRAHHRFDRRRALESDARTLIACVRSYVESVAHPPLDGPRALLSSSRASISNGGSVARAPNSQSAVRAQIAYAAGRAPLLRVRTHHSLMSYRRTDRARARYIFDGNRYWVDLCAPLHQARTHRSLRSNRMSRPARAQHRFGDRMY